MRVMVRFREFGDDLAQGVHDGGGIEPGKLLHIGPGVRGWRDAEGVTLRVTA